MKLIARTCLCIATLASLHLAAETIPSPSSRDPRIGLVDANEEDVVVVSVAKGVVTRVILPVGETVVLPGTGFPAACKPGNEWCITAEPGQNQIWVKPFSGATSNNLELQTTGGNYSFSFVVIDSTSPRALKKRTGSSESSSDVFYRVVMRKPLAVTADKALAIPVANKPSEGEGVQKQASEEGRAEEYLRPQVRNYKYLRRGTTAAAAAIAPSVVFDDGRFTYLRFEKAQEVPTVFAVSTDGSESRVITHMERLAPDATRPDDRVERDYLVVQRVERKFILRLGANVVEIINQAFDPKGIETYNGTTVEGLSRVEKETSADEAKEAR